MKQKRAERTERRRPLAEINLLKDTRPPGRRARRGCVRLFAPSLLLLVAVLATCSGLR